MPKGIPRDKSIQRKIAHRLKITRGHLDKVIRMVEDQEYCIDVVHQINAVEAALKKTSDLILENHLKTCVASSIKNGQEDHVINEVMQIWKKQ